MGSVYLEGGRVVAEPVKASRFGNCYVFRIVMGTEVVARLSSMDQSVAREWVLAVSAVCSHLHACVRTPPVEECEPSPENVAAEKMESSEGAVKENLPKLPAGSNDIQVGTHDREQMLPFVRSRALTLEWLHRALATICRRPVKFERRALFAVLASLLLVLFARRRSRQRSLVHC